MLNLRTDEIYLTRFLSCCEWNVSDAFIRLTKLFKLKVSFENVINLWTMFSHTSFRFRILILIFICVVREPEMVFQQETRRVSRHFEAQCKGDAKWPGQERKTCLPDTNE